MVRVEELNTVESLSLNEPTIFNADARSMFHLSDESIDLIITSPPYWNIKNYGNDLQIGWNQTLSEYKESLDLVWQECFRVLKPGGRICINIGDQYQRATTSNPYHIIPLHSIIINQLISRYGNNELIYLGSIIWNKISTTKMSGGGVFMGSYPYPTNGLISYNHEYIAIFKKIGSLTSDKILKENSKLTKEEWSYHFTGLWKFPGVRQKYHIAEFPEELPNRLIKMFSIVGQIVLDPFCGTGTTLIAASKLSRRGLGYEIGWQSKIKWKDAIRMKFKNSITILD